MTFENRNEHQYGQRVPDADAGKTVTRQNPGNRTQPSPDPATPDPREAISVIGGQPKADNSGLDISRYTGPGSKPSSAFDDPAAPSGTGPGNGRTNSGQADNGRDEGV